MFEGAPQIKKEEPEQEPVEIPELPKHQETEPTEQEDIKQEAQEILASADKGIINKIRKFINSNVAESKLPTKEGLGYESTIGIYGGRLVKDEQGRLVYDTRHFKSKFDVWGDRLLRSFDEHHPKQPGKMALRNPLRFLKLLPFIVDSKRYRGTPEQTLENIKRFGLEDMYGAHPWGIEIKDPEAFSHLFGLQDIFRQDLINSEAIADIDRFEALGSATDYIKQIHETVGGIAEGNVYTFLFKEKTDHKVDKPTMMIPTEIYNPEKNISDIEKKSTDLLDFMASVGIEEFRRSKDWDSVRNAFALILQRYGNIDVIRMVKSYTKRGRLTLPNDIKGLDFKTSATFRAIRPGFAAHNTQRLGADPEITAQLRREIIDACEKSAPSVNS